MLTRIFIVDDHYMVIEGIRSLLQAERGLEWMGHAMNADSCLAFLQQQQPDILLMDINMPGMGGIELCALVRKRWPSVFVIGLSTFNQQSFIQKMMEHGASGYVLKNATREELLEAISVTMKGGTYLSEEASAALRERESGSKPVITRREKEVLELIAEGLTNQEIAEKLFISPATVDTHRKNLLIKFNTKNTASLVSSAIRQQLI